MPDARCSMIDARDSWFSTLKLVARQPPTEHLQSTLARTLPSPRQARRTAFNPPSASRESPRFPRTNAQSAHYREQVHPINREGCFLAGDKSIGERRLWSSVSSPSNRSADSFFAARRGAHSCAPLLAAHAREGNDSTVVACSTGRGPRSRTCRLEEQDRVDVPHEIPPRQPCDSRIRNARATPC